MLYIMKRTQLYLDDDLWGALHAKALLGGTSISELVRTAARERYMVNHEERARPCWESWGYGKIARPARHRDLCPQPAQR